MQFVNINMYIITCFLKYFSFLYKYINYINYVKQSLPMGIVKSDFFHEHTDNKMGDKLIHCG